MKKIKPKMANAQGLMPTEALPKIPKIPKTRAIAPPMAKIIPNILIIIIIGLVINYNLQIT